MLDKRYLIPLLLLLGGSGVAYLLYKNRKKANNLELPNSNENPTSTGSSGSIGTGQYASSGSIGTRQYNTIDENRQSSCDKDFNCKSFLNSLNGLMDYYNTDDSTKRVFFNEGYGVFMYDETNKLWFFSIIKGVWIRQLVPSTYRINPNVLSGHRVSLQQLKYAKQLCDAVVITDSNLKQKLEFNNNGCVTKIKKKPIKIGGGGGKYTLRCAMNCITISDGYGYVDCMNRCASSMGIGNISIYKSAIGTSQYNW